MKVILNHAIDPRIELKPNVGSDRSWIWSAVDFSEGELEEKVFALRFANSENAKIRIRFPGDDESHNFVSIFELAK